MVNSGAAYDPTIENASLCHPPRPAAAQAWLAAHPTIAIVARDRGGGYGEAVAKVLPHARQVPDRLHLMENASRALLDAISKSMRQIRREIGARSQLLTPPERLQYEGVCAARRPIRPSSGSCARPGATCDSWRKLWCLPDSAEFA